MNVLYLIHRYPPATGGSERFTQAMAQRLVAGGHRATVYTSNLLDIEGFWTRGGRTLAAGTENDQGVVVRRFQPRVLPLQGIVSRVLGAAPWAPVGLALGAPGLLLPGLYGAVRRGGPYDLVHASAYPSLMYLGQVAARRSGARLVVMPCTHDNAEDDGFAAPWSQAQRLARIYRQADAVIALTEREGNKVVASGISAERIHVTGAGIEPQAALGADGRRFRQRCQVPPASPVVTFLGHKTAGKGALCILDVSENMISAGSPAWFVLAGSTTPDFTRRYKALPSGIRKRVLNMELSEREKHDLLAASDMLLLPSRDDSFGIVLLEAWLHGKPVIGARAGGIPDVIEGGETGLLVPFGNADALEQGITWLLENSVAAAQMGALGRERTLRRWTWDAVYDRVRTVYEQCLTD
ncbi:glycosyltransferase family 4 protein [Chloroflexota bacterium]